MRSSISSQVGHSLSIADNLKSPPIEGGRWYLVEQQQEWLLTKLHPLFFVNLNGNNALSPHSPICDLDNKSVSMNLYECLETDLWGWTNLILSHVFIANCKSRLVFTSKYLNPDSTTFDEYFSFQSFSAFSDASSAVLGMAKGVLLWDIIQLFRMTRLLASPMGQH